MTERKTWRNSETGYTLDGRTGTHFVPVHFWCCTGTLCKFSPFRVLQSSDALSNPLDNDIMILMSTTKYESPWSWINTLPGHRDSRCELFSNFFEILNSSIFDNTHRFFKTPTHFTKLANTQDLTISPFGNFVTKLTQTPKLHRKEKRSSIVITKTLNSSRVIQIQFETQNYNKTPKTDSMT